LVAPAGTFGLQAVNREDLELGAGDRRSVIVASDDEDMPAVHASSRSTGGPLSKPRRETGSAPGSCAPV
jgi:hypothetical protein